MVQAKRPVPYFQKDYRDTFKMTLLSWIPGSAKFSYERSFHNIDQSRGWCVSAIDTDHEFFLNENRKYSYNGKIDGVRTLANNTVLLGTIGYQYMYKRFLADFWSGGGYAVGTPADTIISMGLYYGTFSIPKILM